MDRCDVSSVYRFGSAILPSAILSRAILSVTTLTPYRYGAVPLRLGFFVTCCFVICSFVMVLHHHYFLL